MLLGASHSLSFVQKVLVKLLGPSKSLQVRSQLDAFGASYVLVSQNVRKVVSGLVVVTVFPTYFLSGRCSASSLGRWHYRWSFTIGTVSKRWSGNNGGQVCNFYGK